MVEEPATRPRTQPPFFVVVAAKVSTWPAPWRRRGPLVARDDEPLETSGWFAGVVTDVEHGHEAAVVDDEHAELRAPPPPGT